MLLYKTAVEFSSKDHSVGGGFYMLESSSISPSSLKFLLEFENNQNREIVLSSDRDFTLNASEKKWIFTVKDVVSFEWVEAQGKMSYVLHKLGTMDLCKYWLSHTVFPVYLTLEKNYYFLHVGAVVVEDKPVLFMANSYGGKSTLTDYFLQRGHTLITDDKIATYEKEGKFYGIPSYPYHRPYREVETLGIFVENFDTEVRALENVYVLEKSDPNSEINIRELTVIEKFKQLRYGSEIEFPFLFEKGVEYLWRLLNQIKVYKITVPWDLKRLDEVYDAITEHQKI